MAAVPISRPRRGGGVRPWPAAWLSVSQTHGRVGRLGCCLGQTARGSWLGQGGGGTGGGGGGLDTGQSSSQHQAELPNATKRWRHKSL